jgi:integrase
VLGKDDAPPLKFEDAISIFVASRYGIRESTDIYSTLVELLLYTGQRRGEAMNLRSGWID